MTSEAPQQPEGTHPAPGRLYAALNILTGVLAVLATGMIFVWLYAEVSAMTAAAANQTPDPWAGFAWAAMWGLVAAFGACGILVRGLVLCARPALFTLIAPGSVLSRSSAFRRWPRLTSLTYVWAGVWFITFALTALAQVGQVARGLLPHANITAVWVTLAVAALPWFTLMLAGRLVRRRSQRPVAQDGPPPRRGE